MKTPKNPQPDICFVCQEAFSDQNPVFPSKEKRWKICTRCRNEKSAQECLLALLARLAENV